jgi:hypothetical protein
VQRAFLVRELTDGRFRTPHKQENDVSVQDPSNELLQKIKEDKLERKRKKRELLD